MYQQLYGGGDKKSSGKMEKQPMFIIVGVLLLSLGIIGGSVGYRNRKRNNGITTLVTTQKVSSETEMTTENISETEQQEMVMASRVNHTKREIEQMLEELDLVRFHVEWKEDYSDAIMAGLVMGQSIPSGEKLESGKEYDLTLTLSSGPRPVVTTQGTTQTIMQSTATAPAKKEKQKSTNKQDNLDGFIQ